MTAAFLQSELTTLISDSRRKNNETKTAAERSLAELKAISVTSETQLAGDLIRKLQFIEPFLLACKSQNVKLASTGAACLQRLVASTAIPRSQLAHLLEAFEDAAPLALEVQLKILQTLPSLLQLYATDIYGETLSRTLSVSADLSNSKSPIISNTAAATFQQLVSTVFEAATLIKKAGRQSGNEHEDALESVSDALSVYIDLCALLSDNTTKFVRLDHLPPASVLGTLESLLATHGPFILNDADAHKASQESLVPGLCGLIENSANFGIVARALRIIFILTSQHLDLLSSSLGEALKIVLKVADRLGNHKWKRVLGLEFFRGLCSDFESLSRAFAVYDLKDNEPNIISGLMSSLVRIASEDPSLIGLGRQSTVPSSRIIDSSGDATSAVDIPGSGLTVGSVAHATSASAGISSEWSTLPTPCLDQFEKSAPPEIPETYVYTLVLGCSSAFSDGLSKFLMPLSVPSRKSTRNEDNETEETVEGDSVRRSISRSASTSQKYQQLINPMHRKHLSNYSEIETCAKMIEACWPAILASCSTFLNAALDSYFYHILVRTVQKLTQVAGVMELLTPRDALLTTLAKVSVPPNVLAILNTFYGTKPALRPLDHTEVEEDSETPRTPISNTPRQSIDMSTQTLNVRNLLCLRALLNLGIALGPTMSYTAWMIVIQPMAQVDALMSVAPASRTLQATTSSTDTNEGSTTTTLGGEISAVDVARRRLFDSTKSYTDTAFQQICQALLKTIEDVIPPGEAFSEPKTAQNRRPNAKTHTSTRSVSSGWTKTITFEAEVYFVLKTIGRLASTNLDRFGDQGDAASSWDLIVSPLLRLQGNTRLEPQLRLLCTNIIDGIIVESSRQQAQETNASSTSSLLSYGLPTLQRQVQSFVDKPFSTYSAVDLEITQLMLSALENVIGSRGESLKSGWEAVFHLLEIIAHIGVPTEHASGHDNSPYLAEVQSRLYPAAFKVTQLVVSDFLSMLDEQSLAALLSLFEAFGMQQIDLNMSLTTIALFWNINTLILDNENHRNLISRPSRPEIWNSEGNLWQNTVGKISMFCKDDRNDVRNAALRMLSRILDASILHMSSRTLNFCIQFLLLPILSSYQQCDSPEVDSNRHSSFISILEDLTNIAQKYPDLLIEDDAFQATWLKTIDALAPAVVHKNVSISSTIFDSAAAMVLSFVQSRTSSSFTANDSLLRSSWIFWKTDSTRPLTSDMPNAGVAAAQIRFLIQLFASNFVAVAQYENSIDSVKQFVKKTVSQVRHDQYTIDVSKLSQEQELLVQILEILRKLLPADDMQYAQFLLELVHTIISEKPHTSASAAAKGTRIPTNIALANACVDRLRAHVQTMPDTISILQTTPVQEIINTSAVLTATKYSSIATNLENPLWKAGTSLGCGVLIAIKSHAASQLPSSLMDSINMFLTAVVSVPHLEALPEEQRPPVARVASDTTFDTSQLHELHTATLGILARHRASKTALKTYVTTFFRHSLAAYPLYDDFPREFDTAPLTNISAIRRGSIRRPDYPIRDEIHFEALKSLLSLVSRANNHPDERDTDNRDGIIELATIAAPYVLLRLVYPIKTFLADQPLRYLTPPPAKLLTDLSLTLSKCLALRVRDRAFTSYAEAFGGSVAITIADDGKSHLRILYGFITQFEEFWRKLPRLKRGYAWQDMQEGQDIENTLKEWKRAISQGWGI